VRNVMHNVIYSPFKLHRGGSGDVALHNTVVKCGDALGIYPGIAWNRSFFRNNLFIGGQGGGTYGGFGNGTGWSDDAGHTALEWNAGLQLAWPLFTGGAVRRGMARTAAAERAALAAVRTTELQIEEQVDRALARVTQAHARAASLATAVLRFAEVARIDKLSLDAGSGTQTDYLRAEADLLEARAGLVDARNGEMAARAELARVAGILDRRWVESTLENHP
jgi:outer membrane protein TolC